MSFYDDTKRDHVEEWEGAVCCGSRHTWQDNDTGEILAQAELLTYGPTPQHVIVTANLIFAYMLKND